MLIFESCLHLIGAELSCVHLGSLLAIYVELFVAIPYKFSSHVAKSGVQIDAIDKTERC